MRILLITVLLSLITVKLYAAQSMVLETEGYACMGDDKSRKQTESLAFQDGKRKATESAASYIQAETHVKDGMMEKALMSAYANAQVKVIQELMKEWYKKDNLGECYRVKMKVEVAPDEEAMASLSKKNQIAMENDPGAPLNVKIWTDRPAYTESEQVRIYVKGNKPFYGRIVYNQADSSLVQLLPSPYRRDNYFNGGVVYELPSDKDRFSMKTCAPFGQERITLYASTAPGGDPELVAVDSVYQVMTKADELTVSTRGIKLENDGKKKLVAAEFAESIAEIKTGKK